eukprot:4946587-Pyramimonas_sp.AAC.1
MGQSDAGRTGLFSQRANQTQDARVAPAVPGGGGQPGVLQHLLVADVPGIFSRRTNQTQETRVYSHEGPIKCRKRGYILTRDQSDAGSA